MIDWSRIPKEVAQENIELLRSGMRTTLPALYALPSHAQIVHQNFVDRLEKYKWGFILVIGENGAGKSAYVKYIENIANNLDYSIFHTEVSEEQIKRYGAKRYFNKQIFEGLRLPDGETLLYKILKNEDFRRKMHQIIENKRIDFEFWSPALTAALLWATGDGSDFKSSFNKKLATSWLRGEPRYVSELRNLEIYDRSTKSLLDVPTDKLIYFLRDLVSNLGCKGTLIVADEVERVGNLTSVKGREALFILRDLINILTSEDSQPARRGILQGVFICYAISTFFLGYSGVLEVEGVDFGARANREGRPKVMIGDVPRLDTILKHSATMLDVELDAGDLKTLAERIIPCYQRATDKYFSLSAEELAKRSFERTGRPLARPNVQEMIRILDSL